MSGRLRRPADAVLLDTDAYSKLHPHTRLGPDGRQQYQDRMAGRTVVIALQTRAELLSWPRLRKWSDNKAERFAADLEQVPTISAYRDVVDAYVDLTVGCRAAGHALAAKHHTADRWVAATALAVDRPLLAVDRIYRGVPGLVLL
jgi:predicted nucleic acid-binding protein